MIAFNNDGEGVMRRLIVTLIGITGLLLIMPVSSSVADPQGKKIALVITNVAQAYIATLAKSVTDTSKQLGMEVSTFSSPFDAALQAQQMDDAIARKYDMIILVAVSEQAIVPAATRAHQAGIPMLTLIQPPKAGTENLYLANIGEDQAGLGRIAGEQLIAAFKSSGQEGGKVAAITGALQEGSAPLRLNAFKEAIKINPKIELAAVEDAKWDTARSRQIASQLLARFASQGGLQAIYGMADNMAVGIIDAVESAGLKARSGAGNVIVVSSNCGAQGIQAIKEGKLYSTATQIPTLLGERAAEAAADYFSGKTLPTIIRLPIEPITRANVDKWTAACTY
jgi:ABC-type sugar transport system substrate-binding protein